MRDPLFWALARCFLAGEPIVEKIVERGNAMLGRRWRWLPPLAKRYVQVFSQQTRPREQELVRFFRNDAGLRRAQKEHQGELYIEVLLTDRQNMQPVTAASAWDIPPIESVGALAEWLGVEPGKLRWYADLKGLTAKNDHPQLNHYHYRILAKSQTSIRLIEAPKPRLKTLQRRILSGILEKIPVHMAVHGFVQGRSIKTFVAPHIGKHIVLRMDLQDFFPSFRAARIQTFFRTLGYPEAVADLLGGICTNAAPRRLWKTSTFDGDAERRREALNLYSRPHLPQGAPSSPALANLCTYRVDCRLTGLAQSAGAIYTRYADDLAFSGAETFARGIERFSAHVAAILMEEGFRVNFRKTRVMRQGVRQHLAGLVINQHANVMRADFDRLKATLTNCVRHGPESQNREGLSNFSAHLEGSVAFVESINPKKAMRLRKVRDQILWDR
jgi:hypothetical protein